MSLLTNQKVNAHESKSNKKFKLKIYMHRTISNRQELNYNT